jgi:raffinose/stachyose/melibiose transport system substrate-binding protein
VWSFDTPAVRDGAGLIHDIGQAMQPGFLQLDREDALFPFLQGRALMLFTGAWDYGNIAREASFSVGVFRLPPPVSPERTRNLLGPLSEAERVPEWIFGVTRACPHPAEAVDFLRYFTAHANAARFAAAGRFIPAVLQIPPAPELVPFTPAIEGAPTGFRFSFRSYGAGHAAQLISSQLHLLVGRDGSVAKFADAVRDPLPAALRRDLATARRAADRDIRRFDSLAVFRYLSTPEDHARLDALLANQTLRELQGLQDADVAAP